MVHLPRGRHPTPHSWRRVYSYPSRYALHHFYSSTVLNRPFTQVHALYDRNRYVTLPLIVLFLAENVAMTNALIIVVPGVRFDASCTVTRSPSTLVIFAYDNVFFLDPSAIAHYAIKSCNSAAFILFETILFLLTLAKFLIALRDGWGRTPVVHLLMRDGTWAFILIFGPPSHIFLTLYVPHLLLLPSDSLRQRRVLSWRGKFSNGVDCIPVVALNRIFCRRPPRP
jgi:hypothetical protein